MTAEFQCNECREAFANKSDLEKHESTSHASTSGKPRTFGDGTVKEISSAFKRRVVILSYENNEKENLKTELFLEESLACFTRKVDRFLKEHKLLKYSIELHAIYDKPNKANDMDEYVERAIKFETKMKETCSLDDFKDSFKVGITDIKTRAEEFQERDSGFTLVALMRINLNLNKLEPLKGAAAYIELPKELKLKKACINVQNKDDFCFKWAVISAIAKLNKYAERTAKYKIESISSEIITINGVELNFKKLSFPLRFKDASIFERNNPDISINIFGYDEYDNLIIGPYYKTKAEKKHHINLLLIGGEINQETTTHYVWIKNLSRLTRSQQTKHHGQIFYCNSCLQNFRSAALLEKHKIDCRGHIVHVLQKKHAIVDFKNYTKGMEVPFVIYADSECILENIAHPGRQPKTTVTVDKHIPYAFSYFLRCSFDENLNKFQSFKGANNATKDFLKSLVTEIKEIHENYLTKKRPISTLTESEELDFCENNICHICSKIIDDTAVKVRDHCHITGNYRGPAHQNCNLMYKVPQFVPVFFHNFSAYDCHLFVKELNSIDENGRINIIPLNSELYISLSKFIRTAKGEVEIRFLDSYRFMSSSLDSLANNLSNHDKKFVRSFCEGNEDKFNLLIRKGVFPYNYLNSIERLSETCLPPRHAFFNKLTDTECSVKDYAHAQNVWRTFDCKTLEDFLMLYLKTDVLLLTDVFENFRLVCKNIYKLDPCHYYTAPGLSWDAMLKCTNIKLDLLIDKDMILFLQRGIRGGIVQCSQRHSIANNKYLDEEDYDESQPSKYLMYLDANNLYGWAMSQFLPEGGFEWLSDTENFSINSIPDCSDIGYILEVDLEYPHDIHDSHNDLPFCCENKRPPNSKELKLITDLTDKSRYVIHYKNLQQCLKHGLKLKQIHRILKFKQSDWLQKYITVNNTHRTNAKNEFEKNFFKLLNNAVYGKTMENVEKHRDIRIVSEWKSDGKQLDARGLIARPEFMSLKKFDDNMVAIELKKKKVVYNKPIYLGFTILELSKWKMYDFHYDYMLPKYGKNIHLNYMDTDSFIYSITTDDFYKDIKNDIHDRFDTSEYPKDNQFGITQQNKRVLGMMKDENKGIIMKEFIGLRPKMYAFKTKDQRVTKRAKGIKSSVTQNLKLFDYKACLYNKKNYYGKMYQFKSNFHNIFTILVEKITLSYSDNKRHICEDNINTLAWGHYKLCDEDDKEIETKKRKLK